MSGTPKESEGSRQKETDGTGGDSRRSTIFDADRLIAEGLAVLSQKVDQHHRELKTDITGFDRRLMRVEAGQANH